MSKRIKLKNLIKEGIAGSVPSTLSTLGGVVTRKPFHTGISLANIVKEKFGDTRENQEIDTKGFLKAVTNFGSFGKNIYRMEDPPNADTTQSIAAQMEKYRFSIDFPCFVKITPRRYR